MTLLTLLLAAVPADRPVDFARDIQPILAARCLACHGPEKQRGELRLDSRAAALKGGDTRGPAIVPGKSAASPLIKLVSGLDSELRMPPKGDPLTAEQVGLLRAWIDQGAVWPERADVVKGKDHWAFRPVIRPSLPAIKNTSWVRNPVDRFILARLEKEGLAPAPEANRRTLIRRLTFDLHGLPPTVAEVEAFVTDARPQAEERLVERLLASPRYGERWARHWLDVVRFAESQGFEMNQARPNAWPYRDYVIRAFNDDKPYDQFVREQLAGDALGADEATGFLVGGPWDQVKSPDPVLTAQQRADELHDIVSTTGSVFLGLTVGCARCHNHKFDPISHADYHALKAVFSGVQHGERPWRVADHEGRARLAEQLRGELETLQSRLDALAPTAYPGKAHLLDGGEPGAAAVPYQPGTGRGQASDPGDVRRLPTLGMGHRPRPAKPGEEVFAWKPGLTGRYRVWLSWGCGSKTHAPDARYVLDTSGKPIEIARVDQRQFADGGAASEQPLWSGFHDAGVHRLEASSRIVLRNGDTPAAVSVDLLLLQEVSPGETATTPVPHLRAAVNRGKNVERFTPIEAKFVRFTVLATTQLEPCIDELEVFSAEVKPRNVALASSSTKATASSTLPGYDVHKLAHINDGRYGNSWSWISNERGRGWVRLEFPRVERIDRVVWSRDRDRVPRYEDRTATEYRVETSLDGNTWTLAASSADRLAWGARFRSLAVPTIAGLTGREAREAEQWAASARQLEAELKGITATTRMVYAGRFVDAEETYRLHRGDPTQRRERVAPGGLASFGARLQLAADAAEKDRRLAAARWITDPGHPLTARVMVNRLWHYHFGEGIVSTPSDFGLNGARATHPELLDWLAGELVARKWSVKEMHRLIVLSAVYRQSGRADAKALKADAGARLLWRFPPRRVEAESLRDAVLAVSGRLDLTAGGPGFDLFEPNTNYVKVYKPKTRFGPETFRRMVYQSRPRMQLDDTFGAFDCPDAGQVAPRRTRSTTPLQAVNLLNSPFMLEQAGYFADRLRAEAGAEVGAQVKRGFELAFGRPADAEEAAAAEELARGHGLAVFCRALFNANEFVFVP